jgi:H+/gluconate symporter-like permease
MADLLGSIALIIGAGAILGRIIEVSGGGGALARRLIRALGAEHISWALLIAVFLVGIPVFFDVAFFALIPLVWSITKQTRKSLLLYALPVLSALTATHALIPTHGFILAVPMTLVGGITYGVWIGKKIFIEPPKHLAVEPVSSPQAWPPRVLLVLGTILLPVLLIGLAAAF